MAAYKVINLDSPIESDYWVDIPVRDPATNKDVVDEKGRILVQRHVTRSIKNEELSTFNTAVETLNTLKVDYSTFKEEVSTKVNTHDSNILTNTNSITTLTDSVTNHDLQINALYAKINAIQGIDIDDFKYVTETDIKNIKKNYLPLVGGTLTGSLRVQGNETEVNLITDNPSVGSIYLYASKTAKGLGAMGTNNVFTCLADITPDNVTTFYGSLNGNATSSTKTTNDSAGRNIVNTYALKNNYPDRIKFAWDTTFKGYVNVTVDNTTWGLITSQNISSQSVKHATSADSATNATNADTLDGYHHDSFPKVNSALFTVNGLASPGWSAIGTGKGGSCIQVRTTDNTYPSICFHRSGYSHCVLAEYNGQLGTMQEGDGAFNYLITSANIGSQRVNYATNANHATSADSAITTLKLETYKQGSTTETYGASYPVFAQWEDGTNVALKCTGYTVQVDKATTADNATTATNASHATSADSATNATNLGGYPASNYIRSVNSVNADGNGNVVLDQSIAISASGTNYIRFANGTQICWGSTEYNNISSANVTLPVPFVNTNYQVLCCDTGSGRFPLGAKAAATTYFTVFLPSNAKIIGISYIAIGSWK